MDGPWTPRAQELDPRGRFPTIGLESGLSHLRPAVDSTGIDGDLAQTDALLGVTAVASVRRGRLAHMLTTEESFRSCLMSCQPRRVVA